MLYFKAKKDLSRRELISESLCKFISVFSLSFSLSLVRRGHELIRVEKLEFA